MQLLPDTNIFHFVVNCYIVKILVINLNKLLFFRLKRTTDVMFGGKQVIICGYGEVSQRGITLTTLSEKYKTGKKIHILISLKTFNDIFVLIVFFSLNSFLIYFS